MCKIKVISDNIKNLKKYGKSDRYDNLQQKKLEQSFFVIPQQTPPRKTPHGQTPPFADTPRQKPHPTQTPP